MTRRATFKDIHRLLERVGFRPSPVEGDHALYEHQPTGVMLALRPHRVAEKVEPMTLLMVQTTLDQNGFVKREEFEEELLGGAVQSRKRE